MARQTYVEVLDATKHQDDKVNRFLVAIAFLTTGAIAFVLKTELLGIRYIVDNERLPLIAVAAAMYLVMTIAAVILLLMALSTELKLPGRSQQQTGEDVRLDKSLLYFQMIGSQPLRQWFRRWDQPDDQLEDLLRKQYLREAHNLSERARVKYGLTDEAAALYIYGLMWLATGLLLGTHASQRPSMLRVTTAGQHLTLPLAFWPLVIMTSIFAGHAALQIYNVYRHERSDAEVTWRLAANRFVKKHGTPESEHFRVASSEGQSFAAALGVLRWLGALLPAYAISAAGVLIADGSPQAGWVVTATVAACACFAAVRPRLRGRRLPTWGAAAATAIAIVLPWGPW
ncbi:hypothetical protein [Blastococcus brunescens]|uniref:Pycsar effector protein domain-containing protein n=1 Tax=Blastococcus brunescens TaxID=1564165 RepID=A0ABZ1B3J1_9ACTN|nr:hypothetical protein [Blastococcus sp. BMG 8361]WRL65309.1 hypothetical protein U6N30_06545 [Blastococcus sp. BMG 8361]